MSSKEALDYGIIDKILDRNTFAGSPEANTDKKD